MGRLSALAIFNAAVTAIVWAPLALHAQSDAGRACRIAITMPVDGDHVGRRAAVQGTSDLPEGAVLWVLAHRADLADRWWPQGAAIADHRGRWKVSAEFGRPRDVGDPFAVTAVAVNADTHRRLLEWFSTAAARDYPPITLPHAVDGCAPVTVRVRKVSY